MGEATKEMCIFEQFIPRNGSYNSNSTAFNTTTEERQFAITWIQVVLPIVCCIGISGNLLNLVVLTRKRLSSPMQTLERSANIGLTGLALSDLLFSIVALPYPFVASNFPPLVEPKYALVLYYRYYSSAFFNICLMISMYLVMLLAVERYMVTYSPHKAKKLMQPCATGMLVLAVYVVCTVATLPYFLNMHVVSCTVDRGNTDQIYYELRPASTDKHTLLTIYMTWWWPCIAVFGPLLVLLVCNLRLVHTLRSSLQCRCPGTARQKLHSYRVTLILIIIVFMAIVLITPAEVLKLINPYKTWGEAGFIIADVANVLQATNFAFNFMLYCAVDRRFRIMVKELFTSSSCCKEKGTREAVEIPLQNDLRKHTSNNRTFTFKVCKTSTKTSIYKKKIIT